ncbi:UDP-Glycosyltransferase/glycogen phosphorylase [Gigaspora margarita]|uniref:UDP-Glycosyltransferase/glycogen phosphorylase n=2 Tax=Gigaspora margarita TaxID=4874 RepID=A0A8H4B1Q8_GIGMA|nr:UDP-Glycosyltransferase/glycogen phosphorylase [Gigaspora margarita]
MIGRTHLPQMCEILKILKDRGYDVTLISPGNYTAQSIHYRSIPQIIFENEFATNQINSKSSDINKVLLDNDPFKMMPILRKLAVQSYTPFYNIYKQVADENEVDLFFCDYMPVINHPCFDLAWKLGKPAVGISTDISIISNAPYKSDPMLGCHANMENESFYDRFNCAIILPLKLFWSSIDFIRDINAKRANVGVDPHWDLRGRVSNLLMLSNTFFGFEVSSSDSPLHQEIGPVLPDTFPGLTPVLDSFLADHPRTIYFALGTNAIISSQNVIIILNAFIKLIDQNVIDGVIWSTVRTDISESLEYANSSVSISTILNNQHPNIHISKFSPQFAILSHKNTKLFLSHGGAGSSHESMYTGTPMLVLPIMGDQPRNAEMLESAGMALKLSKNNLKVDDIVSKVERLLNEGSFKMNAERVQFLAKVNSKRKYRAADLMEIVLNTAKYEGVKDENGGFKIDNEKLLRDWITPDKRMGFIRGKYLDVYGVAVILLLALGGGFVYTLLTIVRYTYIISRNENRNDQKSLKPKKE